MTREEKIFSGVQQHEKDFKINYPHMEWVGLFLQGSQNYELDYEDSDIDTKMIVLPSFEDIIVANNPISQTHIRDNSEHIDVKDIRVILDTIRKQNINFVEILFTKYRVLNPKYEKDMKLLLKHREEIARYDVYGALNCMVGMSMQKYKAMEHPYPTIVHKIEKYGYDPKQLHHIVRMRDFIFRYTRGEDYASCLIPSDREYLIEVKKGLHSLDEARTLAERLVKETRDIKEEYMSKYENKILTEVEELMLEVKMNMLKQYFREQLL